jgi:hypothetical protein
VEVVRVRLDEVEIGRDVILPGGREATVWDRMRSHESRVQVIAAADPVGTEEILPGDTAIVLLPTRTPNLPDPETERRGRGKRSA